MNKTKQLANYLTYSNHIAKALNNLAMINSFQYKRYFIVPKVTIEWRMSRSGREYGGLYLSIHKKLIRGWIQFDAPILFDTKVHTQSRLNSWLSQQLTRVINSIEVGASMDKSKAKKVVEQMFNVKVTML